MQTNTDHNMKSIGQLFDRALPAINKPRFEKKKAYRPENARFKLQFVFHDGSKSIPYHSYDFLPKWQSGVKKNVSCEDIGYAKLVTWIHKKIQDEQSYFIAQIWCKLGSDMRTELNDYDYSVYKHVNVRNKPQAAYQEKLQFVNGKLNTDLLRQKMMSEKYSHIPKTA